MSLRSALLPLFDQLRGLPNTLGLRLYKITVRVRTWSGSRVGLGTKTDTDTVLHTQGGAAPVKVRQLTAKDVVASGGLYTAADYEVGPITPAYSGGGYDPSAFDPPETANTEVFYQLTGPGFPEGAWFRKVGSDVSKNFRYTFVLRKTAEVP